MVGRYTPEQLYSTKRDAIQQEIFEETKNIVDDQYIQLNEVLVRDVTLPETIKEAAVAIDRAIQLYPTAERYVRFAQLLIGAGGFSHAQDMLRRAEALDDREGGIYLARGQLLCAQGRFDAAIPEFERAAAVDPVMTGPKALEMKARAEAEIARRSTGG